MITVMAATGNTGQVVTEQLLESGERVRVLGRSRSKLEPLVALGAEPFVGDPTDAAYLTAAFDGAQSVYALTPYDPTAPSYLASQAIQGEAIAKAISDASVPYVVALSSLGAESPTATGLVSVHHTQEQRLRTITNSNILLLRAAAFFENFFGAVEMIAHEGFYADTMPPDFKLPMIATPDIAAVAAEALVERDWSGIEVREVLGQRDLSYAEAVTILGESLGKPGSTYVQMSDAEIVAALNEIGWAEDFAELYVQLNRAISDGTVASREGRTPANTTPTPFESFASALAGESVAAA